MSAFRSASLRRPATIEFSLPRSAHVRLTVHDLQGRLVSVAADGLHVAGNHRVVWDTSAVHLEAGLYFVRYQTPEGTSTRSLIVLK